MHGRGTTKDQPLKYKLQPKTEQNKGPITWSMFAKNMYYNFAI